MTMHESAPPQEVSSEEISESSDSDVIITRNPKKRTRVGSMTPAQKLHTQLKETLAAKGETRQRKRYNSQNTLASLMPAVEEATKG